MTCLAYQTSIRSGVVFKANLDSAPPTGRSCSYRMSRRWDDNTEALPASAARRLTLHRTSPRPPGPGKTADGWVPLRAHVASPHMQPGQGSARLRQDLRFGEHAGKIAQQQACLEEGALELRLGPQRRCAGDSIDRSTCRQGACGPSSCLLHAPQS
ncbi:hypothetical protein L226DRAFT_116437 [Lentinus tigrinus ALCF2SS1-7]|uniref:uncharacterized protein n=1 Tax=Lentinus tigrinus ALCF2SS1-7 TaxID=1328758 RepID=UPI0011661D49|nr:hypothetical protein L226DRAFT_116437 [Lentinus tigrinus ALCF2SS1-7]